MQITQKREIKPARGKTTARALALGVFAIAIGGSANAAESSCQAPGWDMSRELKAFASTPIQIAAGSSVENTPLMNVDTLYAVKLRAQGQVQFLQPPERTATASAPMGGVMHFSVLTGGKYRVTTDAPLWIDLATPTGIIPSSAFTGWHECSVFRKTVEYQLHAGQSVTLQFSGASAELVKVTIEPPPQDGQAKP